MFDQDKYMSKFILFLFLGLAVSSCQIDSHRDFSRDSINQNPESGKQKISNLNPKLDARYNLTEDRSKFEELRQNTSEDHKQVNDEKALILGWMTDYKKEPFEIREKFSALIRKKREKFNQDLNKIREEYSGLEKKNRENFLKALDSERNEIKEQKLSREKMNDLFNEIEIKRKEYLSKSRDERADFEEEYRQKRKDFDEYIKEKTDDFNLEMKSYTEKFNQLKKELKN